MNSTQQQVAMITGGNSGIGLMTASKLAGQGFHIILASRNQQSSAQAIARITAEHPGAWVESIPLDLSSFTSIRQCVADFHGKGYPLHLLINNAGGAVPGKTASFSKDGLELTLATNHLGHFLLTNLLLDDLKHSAPARVITVSSRLHDPAYSRGPGADFDYDNLMGEKYYDPRAFYRNSKLANMWFAYELNRRLAGTGVTSNAVCPGFVPEAIGNRRKSPLDRLLYNGILAHMPFARSVDEASASYLVAALDPRYAQVGGKLIADGKEVLSSEESYDEQKARRLWEMSLIWCGLDK